ncbi:MAG TPA: 16S rRNA (cytosine(1402)-N(4))-methyltransferase RsmH [Phycisphaerae bacterium]|nr:16S rRNA (cytosine(1402)-N(4))-methyltransferase RsmH [Phycisphaerae bacterium]
MPYHGEHLSVLLNETLDVLSLRPGELVLDGTVGGGGHAVAMLERIAPDGRLIGLDRDAGALEVAASRLAGSPGRSVLRQEDFADFQRVLDELDVAAVDAVLLDLGVSSFQFGPSGRGFSFQHDEPLDMRMDVRGGPTAADLVNDLDERELADLFYTYGEERNSRRIARRLVEARRGGRIETTGRLAELIVSAQGQRYRGRWQRIHPATKCFMALRIAVNEEIESLQRFCDAVVERLNPGGRVAIISFHSLEDRIVKTTFRRLAAEGAIELLTRKPIVPGEQEEAANPRSRSAKLRAARRLGGSRLHHST